MYSPHNGEKFLQGLETQSSEKEKVISGIFIPFLKSTRNLACLEKKDHFHNLNISEVIHSVKCSYLNAKEQMFQNSLPQ